MIGRIIIVSAALAFTSFAAAAELRLKVSASTEITLSENPSTGYSWRIDETASKGAVVTIVDNGRAPPASAPGAAPLVGAPGTHRWTIRALKPGEATVVFSYQRPWEPQAVETRAYRITVSR